MPEGSMNDKLDPAIHDSVKSAFVHSCDGLAKAARLLFESYRRCLVKISLKTYFIVVSLKR